MELSTIPTRDYHAPAQAALFGNDEEWRKRAEELFLWVLSRSDKPLLTEVVASTAYAMGLERPREPRAWGGLTVSMRDAGKIVADGVARDHRGSFKTTWRAA